MSAAQGAPFSVNVAARWLPALVPTAVRKKRSPSCLTKRVEDSDTCQRIGPVLPK
jgi:hypothetical protein